jgi:hypothetical protein
LIQVHFQQDDVEEALATAATSSSWIVHVVRKYHAHHCVRRQLAVALVEPSLRYHDELGHLRSLQLQLVTLGLGLLRLLNQLVSQSMAQL